MLAPDRTTGGGAARRPGPVRALLSCRIPTDRRRDRFEKKSSHVLLAAPTTRFRPSDFAWYRALSALSKAKLISASPARTVEMPKLAVMRIAITLPESLLGLTDVLMAARLSVCRADPKKG